MPTPMLCLLLQRGAEEAADRAGDKLSEAKGKASKAAEEAKDSAAGGWFGLKVGEALCHKSVSLALSWSPTKESCKNRGSLRRLQPSPISHAPADDHQYTCGTALALASLMPRRTTHTSSPLLT